MISQMSAILASPRWYYDELSINIIKAIFSSRSTCEQQRCGGWSTALNKDEEGYDPGLSTHILWSSTEAVFGTGTLPAPLPVLPSPGFLELGWKNFP